MKLATVKNEATKSKVLVSITSDDKPDISDELQNKWQKILDLAAKIIGVPSGLITRLHEKELEVFLTSRTEGNIFQPNIKLNLGLGWYCESVASTRNPLIVPNAVKMEEWKDNPSIPFEMISYMGIPILWPDGEIFGTFCMLDKKENQYSELYKDLLISLREIIQSDSNSTLKLKKAQQDVIEKEHELREVHHRVKNHFALLISTLNLQTFFKGEKSVESILADVQSRIIAISLVHDKLFRSMNPGDILLGDYMSELGKHLIDNLSNRSIDYSCESYSLTVDAKITVPCGLILNELITNSLKYAFIQKNEPKIRLKIKKNENSVELIYQDNGPGLPNNYTEDSESSLGMLLIKQSVLQLGGDYEFTNDNGFIFTMRFKI